MKNFCLLIALIFAAASLAGCRSVSGVEIKLSSFPVKHESVKSRGHGPPPHAPAHGYRHKHKHGVELVFDGDLGVYIAVGFSDIFFHNDLYIRMHDGRWEVSALLKGPWRKAKTREVPYKLKKAKGKKHPGKGHARRGW